jgi:hypothetical protein
MKRARQSSAQKPTILVLATSHLANRGHDIFNAQWDDVRAENASKKSASSSAF